MAEVLGLASSVITVIDLSAKVASWCSEYYANVKNAGDDIERLQRETRGLKATLERVQSLCDGPNGAKLQESQSLSEAVKDCKKQLDQLETKLEPRATNKLMSRYGMRALRWPLKSKEVDGIMKKLGHCKDNISFSLQVEQEAQILDTHQKIVLDKLPSADNAEFDSHDEEHNARCYQGTRVELLRQIDTWASNRSSERIFWLNGMAGTGKSTISRTVAQTFADKGDLGASFFFKRGEGDRGHAGMFITTVATQLIQKLPSLAPHVQDAIEADPGISKKALKQQFNALVLQPLGKIRTHPQSSSIVIVIDALDECDREEDVRTIIRLFSQVKHITSIQIKFFLTSRPELPIRLGFEDICGNYPRIGQATQLIQSLVGMAIPLFIFATTVCRFINDRKCGQPKDQLAKVLKYETRSQASKLDATYLPVLDQLLVGVTISERRALVEEFLQVIGSIIILASPLSANSLDRLLGVPEGTVDSRTDLLHSVLSIPSRPDHPIRLLHLSFRDFLVDTEKRETNPFWVDEKDGHNKLVTRCLKLLSTSENLKKDICNLRTPERPRADVDKQTIDSHLPSDIQYACQYWEPDTDLEWNAVLQTLEGHSSAVHSVAFSHDSRLLASASDDNTVKIWDAATGTLQQTLEGHSSAVHSVAFSHDSRLLASASDDNTVKIWDAATGTLQQTLEGHSSAVHSVAFSHDSRLLASASGDNTGHGYAVYSVAFSDDSKLLASASFDKTVKVWDTATGTLQQTLKGHSWSVGSVAFSHDSRLLASASSDKTVKIWDTATGTLQQTLRGHSSAVDSIAFSHDSRLLASASYDNTVKVWDTATGTLQQTLEGQTLEGQTLEGHGSAVVSVAFSHDSRLIASPSSDNTVKVWDAATGTLQQMLEGHSNSVSSVAFSHDSRLLASASYDKTVKVWDAAIGRLQQTLKGHSSTVDSVTFSHNSRLLASASYDNTVKVWDAAAGTLQQTLKGHSRSVSSATFSHDSRLLASASSDNTVKVWDTATGTLQQTLEGHSSAVHSVAFSHDSRLLASASDDNTVKIWDTAIGTLQQTLEGHGYVVYSVAFSHNSRLLALGSSDNTVKVWDAATGTLQQTLKGHRYTVSSVAFSHDSRLLASGSYDSTVKVWDAATGTLQQTLEVNKYISTLSFDITDSILITNIGCFKVNTTGLLTLPISSQEVGGKSDRKGLGISGHWVTWNNENLLWLPSGFRALNSSISYTGSTLAIGCSTGKVFVIGVSINIIRSCYS
ncbi:hypothetical protein V498_03029 [Pseudogymnoascus sp. VKM F-4517 (FW-2822)]|nr:hypothetical protein V498_03029 [Pseudogymnoascus sp. VKM F-4517 (FW-2822)]